MEATTPALASAASTFLGSATYNATATLGVAALVRPLSATGVSGSAWAGAALPLLLLLAASRQGRISRPVGVALLGCYAVFVTLAVA